LRKQRIQRPRSVPVPFWILCPRMIGARRAWFGVHSTIFADELTNALTVPIADAVVHLAQHQAKCNAWAGERSPIPVASGPASLLRVARNKGAELGLGANEDIRCIHTDVGMSRGSSPPTFRLVIWTDATAFRSQLRVGRKQGVSPVHTLVEPPRMCRVACGITHFVQVAQNPPLSLLGTVLPHYQQLPSRTMRDCLRASRRMRGPPPRMSVIHYKIEANDAGVSHHIWCY
jgi:hypothetical protein